MEDVICVSSALATRSAAALSDLACLAIRLCQCQTDGIGGIVAGGCAQHG